MAVYGRSKPRVALLAEGVDRNSDEFVEVLVLDESPSSRRAWIEMILRLKHS